MKTTSTEIERQAYQAEKNRQRLASYYAKQRTKTGWICLPLKHVHLFGQIMAATK